jgi:hypothetical protein
MPVVIQQKLESLGINSLLLFVIHPIIREIIFPFNYILGKYVSWCLYLFTTLAIVFLYLYIKNHLLFSRLK